MPEFYNSYSCLLSIIDSLLNKKLTGILSLETKVSSWENQKSCMLMFNQGFLTFSGTNLPSNQQLAKILGKKFKSDTFTTALLVANKKITNPESTRELINLLTELEAFSWEEVESLVTKKVLLNLECFLSYPGQATWQETDDFDLLFGKDGHGLNWLEIQQELTQRQQQWENLLPTIPSMGAFPIVTLKQIKTINKRKVKKHLFELANGKNTLLDIARALKKDPLKVAQTYVNWVNNDWVSFQATPSLNENLPIILSLDDSPVTQSLIKKALKNKYKILLSSNGEKGLEILYEYSVDLLILDLTLPDTDGLEFCKKIRKIPKLQNIPIIMLTGRDGLADRAKGHFAGADKYLTKPFKAEELKKIVAELIISFDKD